MAMKPEVEKVFRQELTPTHFLERAGDAYAQRIAVTDGDVSFTWGEFRLRARKLASALRAQGLRKGDRVAFLGVNCEPLLLAHFAIPLAGGILVAINTRWSADEIGYVIDHCGARWMFYSPELAGQLTQVPAGVQRCNATDEFEALVASGSDAKLASWLESEDDAIAINYTSGTTGRPKGVVYHHRGAYLNSLAMALDHRLTAQSRYLWTLPMFHCNGWTFTWSVAAVGAHSICIPRIDPAQVWEMFERGVTHFCAAPTVLIMLANDAAAHCLTSSVRVFTAGAPPSPTLIARMTELNFELDHVYGLTETYGPCTISIPPDTSSLSSEERSRLRARQGFPNALAGEARVVDEDMNDVPADASTMGEVVMRGNVVMKEYFADIDATARAFAGGWFHSGDLAVMHPDGSIELRDRKKDIIISGGENISTIEVEQAVASHPAVLETAVVAIPHEKWGEVPKAFVTLKNDASASEADIVEHCRARLAKFKVPHAIEFGPLPKTSTGKIQKFVLREREWQGRAKRIN
jgi:fatty-acyl-CoA synthase